MTLQQQQYLSDWHDYFVSYIKGFRSLVETLLIHPLATDDDRRELARVKVKLHSSEVTEIEQCLAEGLVKQATLDQIERLDKELVDTGTEHMSLSPMMKEVLKYIIYKQIERSKHLTVIGLSDLQIPIVED